MAVVEAALGKRMTSDHESSEIPQPKRYKISELPLTQAQRGVIDGLVHTIKKKGLYDKLRKDLLEQYRESVPHLDPLLATHLFLTAHSQIKPNSLDRCMSV